MRAESACPASSNGRHAFPNRAQAGSPPSPAIYCPRSAPSRVKRSETSLDGVNLEPMIDGRMTSRPKPIFFWSFNTRGLAGRDRKPYIDPELQEGTTPLVKLMNGILTRNFQNFHYPAINERDFAGPRVILDSDYKLVIDGSEGSGHELFNLRDDLAEKSNLSGSKPAFVEKLLRQLREWQQSTLKSLTGADYR